MGTFISNTLYIVLILLVLSGAGFLITLSLERLLPPRPINFNPLDFEKDIEFLHFLINEKIKQLDLFILQPMKIAGRNVIIDRDYETYRDQIINDTFFSLSDVYKATLNKYFTERALIVYIAEITSRDLTAVILKNNFNNLFSVRLIEGFQEKK